MTVRRCAVARPTRGGAAPYAFAVVGPSNTAPAPCGSCLAQLAGRRTEPGVAQRNGVVLSVARRTLSDMRGDQAAPSGSGAPGWADLAANPPGIGSPTRPRAAGRPTGRARTGPAALRPTRRRPRPRPRRRRPPPDRTARRGVDQHQAPPHRKAPPRRRSIYCVGGRVVPSRTAWAALCGSARTEHSQSLTTVQPSCWASWVDRWSRSLLRRILSAHSPALGPVKGRLRP